MKERDDAVYLKHILDAIARIEGYLPGLIRRLLPSPRFFKTGSFGRPKSLEKQLLNNRDFLSLSVKSIKYFLPRDK